MAAICTITLKMRNPDHEDAMSRLGSNAGELNDALITTMKRGGRIVWDVGDGVATASFNLSEAGYPKRILKRAVKEFRDDDEIDCEMRFSRAMPECGTAPAPSAKTSFFTRVASGVRAWLRP